MENKMMKVTERVKDGFEKAIQANNAEVVKFLDVYVLNESEEIHNYNVILNGVI